MSFAYARPTTLDHALELIAEPGAIALAGGTDVVPMRASGLIAPRLLVDVKHVGDLRGITRDPDGAVRIGAATTFRELDGRDDLGIGAVLDGARIVGAEQTRARATLGGNLCRSSPAGDTLAGLIVTGAIAELRSLAGGSREVPVAEFFTGPGRNVRRADELLIAIRIPPQEGVASAYARFTYRESMDLAVVGVAAALSMAGGTCASACVAVAAAAPTPIAVPPAAAALVGTRCEADDVAAAAAAVVAAASPIDDVRGTKRHRLRVLGVIATRVIAGALERPAR